MISALALIVGVLVSVWPLTKYAIHFLVLPAKDQVHDFKLHQFQLSTTGAPTSGSRPPRHRDRYAGDHLRGPGVRRAGPHEERTPLAVPIVVGASGMFVLGMAFGYYVELPPR